jgi:Gas vesicle synthesis protein GvpL/GvpF
VAEYVYGVVDAAAEPPEGTGIAGAPLRLIASRGAAALVSELPAEGEELRLGREEAMTHARVLEQALGRGTVLPMRFGVVVEGPDEVRRRVLDGHADELTAQLAELDGKVELSVRAVYEEDALMREIVESHPDIARRREQLRGQPEDATYYERIALGELVAEAMERVREQDTNTLLEILSPLALAVEMGQPSHERVALSASFLVGREQIARFDDALEEVARTQAGRLRFKLTGPLPPHSFVQLAGAA